MTRPHPTIALMSWLTASFAASFVGWLAAMRGLEGVYANLAKPAWTPPGWVFAPVWTVLYALMGVAAWRVWRGEGPRGAALGAWWLQLALNAAWPWLFFGFGKLGPAFVEIVALGLAVLATLVLFGRRDRAAAWMLAPYLAWVAFAALLDFSIWRMNR